MKELAKKIVNVETLTVEEKITAIAALTYKYKPCSYVLTNNKKAIATMEIGKPYRCSEVNNKNIQSLAKLFGKLVDCGMMSKETVITGRTLTVPNAKYKNITDSIKFWSTVNPNRPCNIYACGEYLNIHASEYVKMLEMELANLSPTIEIKEKITYYTRLF